MNPEIKRRLLCVLFHINFGFAATSFGMALERQSHMAIPWLGVSLFLGMALVLSNEEWNKQ